MAKNSGLSKAKNAKKDEFYTSYEVIQAEINHYEDKFKNKTVLCNCDDPFESNFCKFFLRNFNYLKLKRLICTSYSTSPIVGQQLTLVGWNEEPIKRGNGYVMDISEVPMANGRGVSDSDIDSLLKSKNSGVKKLKGDGDFRSDECIEYMKQADVVITNPPFSLFREYVAQLIEYEKNFLIIGNVNAITYKEIFPLIKDNKMWLGASIHSGDRKFYVPDDYPLKASGCGEDENGRKFIRVKGVRWFTNLDYTKRHEELVLYKKYYGNEEEYPKYDNYDAINVDKTADIPCDYFEYMAVPITYTDKYNPDQFEIINANDIRTNPDTPIKAHGLIKDKDAVITTQIYTKNAEKDLTQTAKTGTILTDRQTDRQTELNVIKLLQYVFGYAVVKLDDIVDFRNGKGHEKNIIDNGKYIVVNSKFVSTNGEVKKYSDQQICPLYKNDILMVMSDLPNGRALAKCYLVEENDKYTLNQRIGAFTVNRTHLISTKYLYYVLNRNRQLLRYDNGADQTNLRKNDILNISIAIPTIEEQQKITDILDRFDSICNDLSIGLPAEIEARKKQYEYYRDKLLTFKELQK